MKSLWLIFEKIQEKMKMIAAFCLMGMCLMTCSDVFLRATLNMPIFGSEELVTIFASLAIAFSLPYAHKKDVHIGVEILIRLLSKRAQSIIKVVTQIFSLIFMGIITYRMSIYAVTMGESGERSMNLEFPTYYIVHILTFCFLIFSIFILKDIIVFFTGVKEDI